MKLGIIADDFTGASDIALTLAEGGMATEQYVGIPRAPSEAEAGVISLKCRTIPAEEAIRQTRAACKWLREAGAELIIYKVCSTFDSTEAGNIGPVTEALAADLGETHVIVCPAFPENGRSVYQGTLFVGGMRLDECGMQDHPLTPMRDADLRRVLAAQSVGAVHHIPAATVWQGPDAVAAAMAALPPGQIIADAVRDEDLVTLGRAARGRKLMTGGSGIAIGLPEVFGCAGARQAWQPGSGRGAVLSGSCSRATRGQVAAFGGPKREVTADAILEGTVTPEAITQWALEQEEPALIYSSADPEVVADAQARHGLARAAGAVEAFHAACAQALVAGGVTRLVVAGGETSGAVVEALQLDAFTIGPKLAAGVPALRTRDGRLSLALKSGNFGGPEFFADALGRL